MNYKTMTKAQLIAHILSLETQAAVQITSCQVYPFKEGNAQGNVRALASIVLNDAIQIRGLRVMNGEHGLYVGFPMDPFNRGDEFRSLCAPVTRAMREAIDVAVLGKFQQVTAEPTDG
jgi:stage V sporulation protein G